MLANRNCAVVSLDSHKNKLKGKEADRMLVLSLEDLATSYATERPELDHATRIFLEATLIEDWLRAD